MKLRIVSDLHLDINHKYPLDMHANGLKDMFTLIAGDISGSPEQIAEWVKANISHGAFISGNHDVYNSDMAIEEIKSMLADKFPVNADVSYFDNDVGTVSKHIGENILLIADVMYTDYAFKAAHYSSKDKIVETNIEIADPWRGCRGGMNDFNYGRCLKMFPGVNDKTSSRGYRLVPEYYLEHHNAAFKKITSIVEENSDKDIVLMTHHCLSPKCISSEYDHDRLNASYVSDKEDWIVAHPNIKCICSGHIHSRKSFKVGNVLYVMNALGYCCEHLKQWSDEKNAYAIWTPDCIVDTSTWTVEFKPHDIPEWNEQYEKSVAAMGKMLPFLF